MELLGQHLKELDKTIPRSSRNEVDGKLLYNAHHDDQICSDMLLPRKLVDILIQSRNLSATVSEIRAAGLALAEVFIVIVKNSKIFQRIGSTIYFLPVVTVCAPYNGNIGCCIHGNCGYLHICYSYIMDQCYNKKCIKNHSWQTSHNSNILSEYYMNHLPPSTLSKTLKDFSSLSYLNAMKHLDLQTDINRVQTRTEVENYQRKPSMFNKLEKMSPVTDGHNSKDYKFQQIHLTCWSVFLQGDVKIPEICFNSVTSSCPHEGKGCLRLHASEHYHWQISNMENRWINLPSFLVLFLEEAFCNPATDQVNLPCLKESKLNHWVRDIFTLLGSKIWQANFSRMILTSSHLSESFKMRRLCTEHKKGHCIKANTFIWYFLDKENIWIKYGSTDSTGNKHLCSTISSTDIERHFSQNPGKPMKLKSNFYSYTLDFSTMTQTNIKTRTKRRVKRRPEPHLQQKMEIQKVSVYLPSSWEAMKPEDRWKRVVILSSSDEYQKVLKYLNDIKTHPKILQVERIQNPCLWFAFKNKIQDMTNANLNLKNIDVRTLFHGTKADVVPKICVENFDWRLHGSNVGHAYGKGTYFSSDPTYAYKYCSADSVGKKHMFVAQVVVGSTTVGDSSMVRPPLNRATGILFDSTVDKRTNPTIFVKYDKQEYYPEYLITLS